LYRLAQQLAVADFQCIEFAFLKHYNRKRRATQRKKLQDNVSQVKRNPHGHSHLKTSKLTKKFGHPDAVSGGQTFFKHVFVNFGTFKWLYFAYYSVYLHQTWGFC